MSRRWVLAVGAIALASTGCSGVVDTSGSEVEPDGSVGTSTNPAAPTTTNVVEFIGADGVGSAIGDTSRIVTLSGDLTELVWELGFGDSVVATDLTTVHPPAAIGLPVVGVGRFLTAEGVLSQAPSLVIGDIQTSPQTAIDQIRQAGVPVVILDVPTSFDGLYEKVISLAEVLAVPEEGAVLVARMRNEIESAGERSGDLGATPRVAFVYSRGRDVILLFGAGMTTQPLIEAAGGADAGAAIGVIGTVPVTPEALFSAAPDVIVITSEGLEALGGIDGLLTIPGFRETPAGASGRILDYPEGDFLTFGPRIAESLAKLVADLKSVMG